MVYFFLLYTPLLELWRCFRYFHILFTSSFLIWTSECFPLHCFGNRSPLLEIVENMRSSGCRFRQRLVLWACCLAPKHFITKLGNMGAKYQAWRTNLCKPLSQSSILHVNNPTGQLDGSKGLEMYFFAAIWKSSTSLAPLTPELTAAFNDSWGSLVYWT